ncbi:MAG: hypothetical protein LKJ47_05785 [Bifidobacteriaceae bacterium]|nr:hypothetical protein [Bifidobacteriaceae bacterium]
MAKFRTREIHIHEFHISTLGVALCNVTLAIGLSLTISAVSAHASETRAESGQKTYKAAQANLKAQNERRALEKNRRAALTQTSSHTKKALATRTQRGNDIKSAATHMVEARQAHIAASQAAQSTPSSAYASTGSYATRGYTGYSPAASQTSHAYRSSASTPSRSYSSSNHAISRSCSTSNQPAACQSAVNGGGLVQINAGSHGSNITLYAAHNNAGGAWIQNVNNGQSVTVGGKSYKAVETRHISKSNPRMATKNGDVWLQTCEENGTTMKEIRLQRN